MSTIPGVGCGALCCCCCGRSAVVESADAGRQQAKVLFLASACYTAKHIWAAANHG